jgi:flavin reductase (DIM6/NTAB) family NADH-FMN oxidoreductase RutF
MSGFPTGVTIITTLDEHDEPHGFTCSSLCALSLEPPMLLVCVDNRSRTLAHICRRGAFAVNLLRDEGRGAAEVFSSPAVDRFAQVRWKPTPRWALPFLAEDAHAVSECRMVALHRAGDHTIVIGAVTEVIASGENVVPLLRGLRTYRRWPV